MLVGFTSFVDTSYKSPSPLTAKTVKRGFWQFWQCPLPLGGSKNSHLHPWMTKLFLKTPLESRITGWCLLAGRHRQATHSPMPGQAVVLLPADRDMADQKNCRRP